MKGHLSGAQDFLCRESGGAVEAKHSGTPGLRQGCGDCDSSGTTWGLGPGFSSPGSHYAEKQPCSFLSCRRYVLDLARVVLPQKTGLWLRVLPRNVPPPGSRTSGCGSCSGHPAQGCRVG